jgi:polysaccharide export outer membrane protein
MKAPLKIIFALVYATALCCAQTEATSPGNRPLAKEAPVPAPPAQTPQTPANSSQTPPPQPAAPATTSSASQPTPVRDQSAPSANLSADVKAPAAKADANSTKKAYVIGPLDVLIIKVWNQANLSGPFDVGPDGMISLPLIGQVKADGLTTRQLEEVLTQRLKEFLNSPEVNAQVGKVNSKRFFVYGEVGRPGEFPLVQETTVMDALSNVGGFRDFANTKKIYVLRGTQKFNFNYKDVSKGKNLEQNVLLQNGDRIFVP